MEKTGILNNWSSKNNFFPSSPAPRSLLQIKTPILAQVCRVGFCSKGYLCLVHCTLPQIKTIKPLSVCVQLQMQIKSNVFSEQMNFLMSKSVFLMSKSVFPMSKSIFPMSKSVFPMSKSVLTIVKPVLTIVKSVLIIVKSVFTIGKSVFTISKSVFPMSKSVFPMSNSKPKACRSLSPLLVVFYK